MLDNFGVVFPRVGLLNFAFFLDEGKQSLHSLIPDEVSFRKVHQPSPSDAGPSTIFLRVFFCNDNRRTCLM
jgi:hypothetical protein